MKNSKAYLLLAGCMLIAGCDLMPKHTARVVTLEDARPSKPSCEVETYYGDCTSAPALNTYERSVAPSPLYDRNTTKGNKTKPQVVDLRSSTSTFNSWGDASSGAQSARKASPGVSSQTEWHPSPAPEAQSAPAEVSPAIATETSSETGLSSFAAPKVNLGAADEPPAAEAANASDAAPAKDCAPAPVDPNAPVDPLAPAPKC